MKITIIITSILMCNFTIAATKKIDQKLSYDPSIIKYSKHDQKVGRRLYEVWKQLKRHKKTKVSIRLLKKELKQSKIFQNLIPIVEHHDLILKSRSVKKFKSNCLNNFPKKRKSIFFNKYRSYLERHCRHKFFNVFYNRKVINKNFDAVKEYLDVYLPNYLKGEKATAFNRFLKRATKKNFQKVILSEMFYQYYKVSSESIKRSHINKLNIHPQFNAIIHKNKLTQTGSKKYFKRELRKQVKTIKAKFNKRTGEISTDVHDLIKFSQNNILYFNKERVRKIFISLALSIYSKESESSYLALLKSALSLSKEGQIHDVNFYVLLNSLINNDFKHSLNLIEKNGYAKSFDTINNSKFQYWIAKTYENNGKTDTAVEMYTKLIKRHPLSYYSIISLKTLQSLNRHELAKGLTGQYKENDVRFNFRKNIYKTEFVNNLKRLHVWLDLHLEQFIFLEFTDLINQKQQTIYKERTLASSFDNQENEKHILYLLLSTFSEKKKHLYSFRLIHKQLNNQSLNMSADILNFLFPIEYWKVITKRSKKIDPILILSLIRQESAFNPRARSPVGAQGLMQLMLPTARQYKKKITRSRLERPKENIKIGVKYLKRLIRKFDNNLIFTLAAYNAGETIVRRWKRKIHFSDNPIVAIEQIPYKETRNYVKLIYRNIFFYKFLDNKDVLATPMDDSFNIAKI